MSPGDRRDMIQPDHPKLSLSAQCRVLNISRSTLYYRPLPASVETLALMKSIDKLFTKYQFFGSRQIAVSLARDGIRAGRHRVPTDGPRGSIQAARDEPAAPGPSGLPLPAEGDGDCAA
jgi:putative transposase